MKTVAVLPAFNEERYIEKVVKEARKYADEVIVIDDCSRDNTFGIAKKAGAKVYRHLINRGVGGATRTGIKAALFAGADIIVILDADGQHLPEDIPALVAPIKKNKADVVIGSRFLRSQAIPFFRRVGNSFFNLFTFFLFGVWSSDTQSGMKALSKKAAEKLDITSKDMEVCSEIIKEAKNLGLKLEEVPIRVVYTPYSLSKGQGFIMGVKTLIKLLIIKLTQ